MNENKEKEEKTQIPKEEIANMILSAQKQYKEHVILGKYNEIGLKSRPVRERMERKVISTIKTLAEREGLEYIKIKREWGRIVLEAEPLKMREYLILFRYIVGLQSYSIALKIPFEYRELKETAAEYILERMHLLSKRYKDKSIEFSFSVRVRRIKSYPKTSMEIEKDIGGYVLKRSIEESLNFKVDLKKPLLDITIEIRKGHAYIYCLSFSTLLGGNPIEIDKQMLILWDEERLMASSLALLLMLRRGALIIPIVFSDPLWNIIKKGRVASSKSVKKKKRKKRDNDTVTKKIMNKELLEIIKQTAPQLEDLFIIFEKISCFYEEGLPLIVFPSLQHKIKEVEKKGRHIKEIIERNEAGNIHKDFLGLVKLTLMHTLLSEHFQQLHLRYQGKKVWIKGLVVPENEPHKFTTHLAQKFMIPIFFPLMGLYEKEIEQIYKWFVKKTTGSIFEQNILHGMNQDTFTYSEKDSINSIITETLTTIHKQKLSNTDTEDFNKTIAYNREKVRIITQSDGFKDLIAALKTRLFPEIQTVILEGTIKEV